MNKETVKEKQAIIRQSLVQPIIEGDYTNFGIVVKYSYDTAQAIMDREIEGVKVYPLFRICNWSRIKRVIESRIEKLENDITSPVFKNQLKQLAIIWNCNKLEASLKAKDIDQLKSGLEIVNKKIKTMADLKRHSQFGI